MGRIRRAKRFHIHVQRKEMLRILGYGRSLPPERALAILTEVERDAPSFIETSCAYRSMKGGELSCSEYLRGKESVILSLVTIGPFLEQAVEGHKKNGDLARALVLDAYGSAAAEAAAEATEALIRSELKGKGLACGHRFSPGYGDWSLEEQKWILPALRGDLLGIALTEGCMMVPRKSITFAMTIGERRADGGGICDVCGAVDCRYRHGSRIKNDKGGK